MKDQTVIKGLLRPGWRPRTMPGLANIILVCLFAASPSYPIQAQDDVQSLVRKLGPAVVSVVAYDKNGGILGRGSGFFITGTGITGSVQVLTRRSLLPTEAARTEAHTSDGQSLKIREILDEDRELDLAIVAVDLAQPKVSPLTISGSIPGVNQRVIVIGGGTVSEPAPMTDGSVSAIQDSPSGKIAQIAGQIAEGSGGSPIINMKGEVVGVIRPQGKGEKVFTANVGDSLQKFVHPVIQSPKLINNPQPSYTIEARRMGVEGNVLARVLIGTDGLVKRVNILRGLPAGLDDQALKAAYSMKFKPATRKGRPIEFWKTLSVEFHLRREP